MCSVMESPTWLFLNAFSVFPALYSCGCSGQQWSYRPSHGNCWSSGGPDIHSERSRAWSASLCINLINLQKKNCDLQFPFVLFCDITCLMNPFFLVRLILPKQDLTCECGGLFGFKHDTQWEHTGAKQSFYVWSLTVWNRILMFLFMACSVAFDGALMFSPLITLHNEKPVKLH